MDRKPTSLTKTSRELLAKRKTHYLFTFLIVAACFTCAISGYGGNEFINTTNTRLQDEPANAAAQIPPQELWLRPADGMPMRYIPAGEFQMGSTEAEIEAALALCREHYPICNRWYYAREGPQHPVSLDAFWLDQTEISNAQYRLCVDAGICVEPLTCKKGAPTYADPDKAEHPVVCVSWDEAQEYCTWAGARLPTEAEWEYAFRGEAGVIFPTGGEFDGAKLNYCDANCSELHADYRFDDGYSQTAPVGSYPQGVSWSGVLDLGGNVFEWVSDWLADYSPAADTNPAGPLAGSEKIAKGCSWFSPPAYCRGALRPSINPDTRFNYLGFRCAASQTQETETDTAIVSNIIAVPAGIAPVMDGTLTSGEWDVARIEAFADGSELFLMHADGYLYLGIRANTPEMIAGNVFIQRDRDILILHSSAALGTAIYRQADDYWLQAQDFDWQCRQTSSSDAARAERYVFLQDEGWVAANSRMGTPEELEYQLEITDQPLRLAASFLRASNPTKKIPWPANLEDDCIKPTPGGFPEQLNFLPEKWALLEFSH
ncbi:MAG: formylglycine-generating enzyme family protein [Chloroflexi bacterium]|jgi:formylglycine-generating enzyme required for sulfatase activity|nr:formylglycine-generating enzyme family protein [Chloroflexota bacterium]